MLWWMDVRMDGEKAGDLHHAITKQVQQQYYNMSPVAEKPVFGGLRPGMIQTGLISYFW